MNLTQLIGMAGSQIPSRSMVELNKALQAVAQASVMKGTVGYPLQGQAYVGGASGTGEIAPLVPQSIQGVLDSQTFTNQHIKFWKMLAKITVGSTLHEATRINEHGSMGLDPWFAEGSVPGISEAQYERLVVRMKYMAEYIELTDVATMVTTIGSKNALSQRTQDGTLALLGKLERLLFNADSNLTPLAFDGLYRQLRDGAPNNYTDARGQGVTPQTLQEKVGEVMSDPNFGSVNVCLVDPRQYQSLANIATSHARHDQIRNPKTGIVTFGHNSLFVGGPQGNVPIVPCPLMRPIKNAPTASVGNNPPNAGAMPAVVVTTPAAGGSQFAASDVGTYFYVIVGVGDEGHTAPYTSPSTAVAAGDGVQFEIADGAAAADGTHSGIRYYRVWRSTKNATSAAGALFMGEFAANDLGGASESQIVDLNANLPGTAPVYLLTNTAGVMYWAQLLDFTRRPLAQVTTTIPFLLMLFGALFVKVPTKNWIIDNVALTY